jgi:hypothetical protein
MKPKYANYVFEYRYGGSRWGFTIPATSEDDALNRLHHIQYATLCGTEVAQIPVRAGFIAKAVCWFRNILHASI